MQTYTLTTTVLGSTTGPHQLPVRPTVKASSPAQAIAVLRARLDAQVQAAAISGYTTPRVVASQV